MLFLFGKHCHPSSSQTFLNVHLNSRKASFARTSEGTYTDMALPIGHYKESSHHFWELCTLGCLVVVPVTRSTETARNSACPCSAAISVTKETQQDKSHNWISILDAHRLFIKIGQLLFGSFHYPDTCRRDNTTQQKQLRFLECTDDNGNTGDLEANENRCSAGPHTYKQARTGQGHEGQGSLGCGDYEIVEFKKGEKGTGEKSRVSALDFVIFRNVLEESHRIQPWRKELADIKGSPPPS